MKYSVFSGVLPELSAAEAAATVASHGYTGIEWRVNGEYHFKAAEIDRQAPEMRTICDDAGLDIVSFTGYLRLHEDEAIRRMVAAAQDVGCPRIRLFSALYDPARGYHALRTETLAGLRRVEQVFAGTGVKALLEIHMGTILCSPSLAYDLVRHFDPAVIGVILDPANMVVEGSMDMRMGLDIIRDYVDLVHVKNVCWERREDGLWRWRFDELADGGLDWADTIAALKGIGYDGYLSFENLYRVPVRHTGYIDEDLIERDVEYRDIDQRLPGDLAYIKKLVDSA